MNENQIEKKAKEIASQWLEPSDYNVARDAATEMADWLLDFFLKMACKADDNVPARSQA